MKRITIAVPQSMIADANEMAVLLGGPNDAATYSAAQWTDGSTLYAVCCDVVEDSYTDGLAGNLPAQQAIAYGVAASPSHIAVIVGNHDSDPMAQIAALGLSRVAQNDPE